MIATALRRTFPVLEWLPRYTRAQFASDLIAGTIVGIMLVPQGMAYAMLAGLPPQIGLYASIVPLAVYGLLGTSRALAVGPVAIASLMVASSIADLGDLSPGDYVAAAVILALLSGAMLLAMGLARLGTLVNFLSHPVISGFTSAAAVIIGFSQLKHLLGLDIPRGHLVTDIVRQAVEQYAQINLAAVVLGFGSIALLMFWRDRFGRLLQRAGLGQAFVGPLSKAGPLIVVAVTTLAVWGLGLDSGAGVKIVRAIPQGLPSPTWPDFDLQLWRDLLPAAFLISIIGFLESFSVAKALASKRRQKVDANQELIALGAANIGAAVSGAYPVSGGFGRSMVNFAAGAETPVASIITAMLIALTLVFLTPLFYFLPRATLAAIIVVAVASLIDVGTFLHAWKYKKADAAALAATFAAVLVVGVEIGIVIGIALSLAMLLWRTSRPHVAIVGRVGDTEHFRNVKRHKVQTLANVLAIRVDESLYFTNASFLENLLLAAVADDRQIEHVVLICSAVNFIDASALDSLENTITELRDAGVTLHLAEVKGPVTDDLGKVGFEEKLRPGRIFLSTHEAMVALEHS